MKEPTVTTHDLYEAAYYLCEEAELETVEIVIERGDERAHMTLAGRRLVDAQRVYMNGNATVNLLAFRRQYQYLLSVIRRAKREDSPDRGRV